jgi:pimeloyl-ACP methyl ester carboxylesterase
MPVFESHGGVQINYVDEGSGPPAVLVHGFASSLHGNWRAPGIFSALVDEGRRVIALDCRGHGRSGKPHDQEQYAGTAMADDVIALMDHLDVEQADLVGYSMGGYISGLLITHYPQRFRSAVLAGIGDALLDRSREARAAAIASALEAPAGERAADDTGRGFRVFAEATGNDLQALAAMQRTSRPRVDAAALAAVSLPVLVLMGDADTLVGSGDRLAGLIPGARLVVVPGDHLTAVGAPALRGAIVDFLREHSPVA